MNRLSNGTQMWCAWNCTILLSCLFWTLPYRLWMRPFLAQFDLWPVCLQEELISPVRIWCRLGEGKWPPLNRASSPVDATACWTCTCWYGFWSADRHHVRIVVPVAIDNKALNSGDAVLIWHAEQRRRLLKSYEAGFTCSGRFFLFVSWELAHAE